MITSTWAKTVNGQTVNSQLVNGQTVNDQTVNDKKVHGVIYNSMQVQTLKQYSTWSQAAQSQRIHRASK